MSSITDDARRYVDDYTAETGSPAAGGVPARELRELDGVFSARGFEGLPPDLREVLLVTGGMDGGSLVLFGPHRRRTQPVMEGIAEANDTLDVPEDYVIVGSLNDEFLGLHPTGRVDLLAYPGPAVREGFPDLATVVDVIANQGGA